MYIFLLLEKSYTKLITFLHNGGKRLLNYIYLENGLPHVLLKDFVQVADVFLSFRIENSIEEMG